MRRVNLPLLGLTIALCLDFTAVRADSHAWTSLQWLPVPSVICPDLPLSTNSNGSSVVFRSSPSSWLGRGLWSTHGAVQWSRTTQWWVVGASCQTVQGWADVGATVTHGWQIHQSAVVALSAAAHASGADGFPWRGALRANIALMWTGLDETWLACTIRNAIALAHDVEPGVELRLGIRRDINDISVTADVVHHAYAPMAVIVSASMPFVEACTAGAVARSYPPTARLWVATSVDDEQTVMLATDVSVLGWRPMISYTHAL